MTKVYFLFNFEQNFNSERINIIMKSV